MVPTCELGAACARPVGDACTAFSEPSALAIEPCGAWVWPFEMALPKPVACPVAAPDDAPPRPFAPCPDEAAAPAADPPPNPLAPPCPLPAPPCPPAVSWPPPLPPPPWPPPPPPWPPPPP